MTASDDPHGVVEFAQPSAIMIQESSFTLSIPIERLGGIVGDIRANFSVLLSSTATSLEDYTIHNQSERVHTCLYIYTCIQYLSLSV